MKRLHEKDHPAFLLPRFRGRAPERRPKVTQPENTTLAEACAWLDGIGVAWWHMPHWLMELAFGPGAKLTDETRDAAEEVRGLPDLLLFYKGHFMAAELKTETGQMSKAQKAWQRRLGTLVTRTLPAFQSAVLAWKSSIDTPSPRRHP